MNNNVYGSLNVNNIFFFKVKLEHTRPDEKTTECYQFGASCPPVWLSKGTLPLGGSTPELPKGSNKGSLGTKLVS